METFGSRDTIYFIPKWIACPNCRLRYTALDLLARLLLPDSIFKCNECNYIFTREYVSKHFGVVKDIGMEKNE